MTTLVRRPLYRFKLAGTTIDLAAQPVQNEVLEGVITNVLDVELAEEPTLGTNETAALALIERNALTITEQFLGRVNHVGGQSYPNRVVLTCTGPLARLRRVPTFDHDLTTMTDGEAVEHVLDQCNIDFDPADIQDAGYVIGTIEPYFWLKDQPGSEVIAEIDRVMGMATIEIGAGRVIRFAYDRAPADADIGVTYTRGIDAEFWRNQRDRGDLDAIVNVWQVSGLSYTHADGCSRSIWARAEGDNADLGAGVRNRAGRFTSDLIQDTALAEAVAERMMRWYNRQPDELTVVALNDINVMPGQVIGAKDIAYGVDLDDDADETPYLVLTADRRGDETTLNCVGGAAGAIGTITSGVEKICNQTSTATFDSPPAFTPPTIGVPPVVPVDDFDEGGGGGGGGGILPGDSWVLDLGTGTFGYGSADMGGSHSSAHNESFGKDLTSDFVLTGRVVPDGENYFGIANTGDVGLWGIVTIAATGTTLDTFDGSDFDAAVLVGETWVDFTISYDVGTDTVTAVLEPQSGGSIMLSQFADSPGYLGSLFELPLYAAVRTYAVGSQWTNMELV